MAAADARSNAFFKAVNDASREEQSALFAEIEKYKAEAIKEAALEAQRKYDEYVAAATVDFASQDGVEAEKQAAELKKEIIDVRTEITKAVFDAVEKKLRDFTESDEYECFLKNSAEQMISLCNAPVTVYLREQDMRFGDMLKKISAFIDVKADPSIQIGGIYGICEEKKVKLNDLLETRLEEQKEVFYESSGLSLHN